MSLTNVIIKSFEDSIIHNFVVNDKDRQLILDKWYSELSEKVKLLPFVNEANNLNDLSREQFQALLAFHLTTNNLQELNFIVIAFILFLEQSSGWITQLFISYIGPMNIEILITLAVSIKFDAVSSITSSNRPKIIVDNN